jgi:hypothetical protein
MGTAFIEEAVVGVSVFVGEFALGGQGFLEFADEDGSVGVLHFALTVGSAQVVAFSFVASFALGEVVGLLSCGLREVSHVPIYILLQLSGGLCGRNLIGCWYW